MAEWLNGKLPWRLWDARNNKIWGHDCSSAGKVYSLDQYGGSISADDVIGSVCRAYDGNPNDQFPILSFLGVGGYPGNGFNCPINTKAVGFEVS